MNFVYFAAGIAVASALFLVGMNYGPGHKEIVASYNQGRAKAPKETTSWSQSLDPIVAGGGIFRSPVCLSGEVKKKLRSLS